MRPGDARGRPRRGPETGAGPTPARAGRAGRHQVSLERALSKLGFSSRSEARLLIASGKTHVNGRVCRDPRAWVDPRRDRLSVSGNPVRPARRVAILLHKPVGIVTTRSDEQGRETVYSLLPREIPYLFPVGRLDKESSGAILLTNDTRLGEGLTDPSRHVAKTYRVTVDRPLGAGDVERFRSGARLPSGERLRSVQVRPLAGPLPEYEFILWEGKNRQIRRMCREAGVRVLSLHRTAIGPIRLGSLAPSSYRFLTEEEITALASAAGERGGNA